MLPEPPTPSTSPNTPSVPCICDTFQTLHFLITHRHWWGQRWRWCRGRVFLKECAKSLRDIPWKIKQNASTIFPFPFLSSTLRETQCKHCRRLWSLPAHLICIMESSWGFFFFTFHTVNQPRLSNGNSDSSQTLREGTSSLRRLSQQS